MSTGYRAARGRYVLSMDGDMQEVLPQVERMFDAIAAGHDVVLGRRFQSDTYLLGYPLSKLLANRMFHGLTRILCDRRTHDVTNNLKLFRREVLSQLRITESGFAANAEIGLQLHLMGLSIQTVSVCWIGRRSQMGSSSFRLLHSGPPYARVLWKTWQARVLKRGPYRSLLRLRQDPLKSPAPISGRPGTSVGTADGRFALDDEHRAAAGENASKC
jgi:hypothetical protein